MARKLRTIRHKRMGSIYSPSRQSYKNYRQTKNIITTKCDEYCEFCEFKSKCSSALPK